MNRFTVLVFVGFLFAIFPAVALADAPVTTIQAGARIEYRFDYTGDGSVINVEATETDPDSLVVSIYTSDKIDAVRRNEPTPPTGRGTKVRGDTLQWSGRFPGAGTYYVVVENRAPFAITYRLNITGSGVSSVARAMASWLGTTSTIIDQKGQQILSISLPPTAVTTTLQLPMPPQPNACTAANQIPGVIDHSIKLCPGQVYPPLSVVGDNIAIYTDDGRSSIVKSSGRQFAVMVKGSNNWIEGLTIQASADPKDAGAWLCLYDQCDIVARGITTTLHGGTLYGGGILLQGSNSTIHGVTVLSGTIGIATVNGNGNKIIENQLSGLNGWGSYNVGATSTYFVGNTWSRDNHGCTAPDGRTFPHGCETSGWVCLGCVANLVSYNQCLLSSNCFYMDGSRGLTSYDNNFLTNYCAGATDNCFEVTFAPGTQPLPGNIFRDNIATIEPNTNSFCNYPFWIGGSIAYFANNTWECKVSEDDAFNQSRDSTTAATNIIRLDNALGALNAPKIVLPTNTATPSTSDASPTPTTTPTTAPTAVPTFTSTPSAAKSATPNPVSGETPGVIIVHLLRIDQILRLVK